MKRYLCMLLAVTVLMLAAGCSSHETGDAPDEETQSLTREDLLAMDQSELLLTLTDHGLILPEDYAAHIEEMAEGFVYEYTPMIMDGEIDPSKGIFNYDQSIEMLRNLGAVLYELGLAPSAGAEAD